MGVYLNPVGMTKEEWLLTNAEYVSKGVAEKTVSKTDKAVLVLVDNNLFSACAVLYHDREFEAFNSPTDVRQKKYYVVDRNVLCEEIKEEIRWQYI